MSARLLTILCQAWDRLSTTNLPLQALTICPEPDDDGAEVSVELTVSDIADATAQLLTWTSAITRAEAWLWRPHDGRVYAEINGQLPEKVTVRVWAALPPGEFGADLGPGESREITLDDLRRLREKGTET